MIRPTDFHADCAYRKESFDYFWAENAKMEAEFLSRVSDREDLLERITADILAGEILDLGSRHITRWLTGDKWFDYLRSIYEKAGRYEIRAWCIAACRGWTAASDEAYELCVEALSDRAAVVVLHAINGIGYSLRKEGIPILQAFQDTFGEKTVYKDEKLFRVKGAILAIEHCNTNRMIDHEGKGNAGLVIWGWESIRGEYLGVNVGTKVHVDLIRDYVEEHTEKYI